ncbi:MAG: hypothetical protein ABW048_07895 [Sphingobium sp.]
MTNRVRTFVVCTSIVALAAPGITQQGSASIARYTMDVTTVSGLAAMGGGMGGAMSMMLGGGSNRVAKQMELHLGSTLLPTGGKPTADHFLPSVAKMGKSVPLTSPTPSAPARERRDDDPPENFQKPKGRLLIFWGCGAHAPKGQPVIIDFAKVAAGQMPPNVFGGGVAVPREWSVVPSNSKTYGEWPNGRDRKMLSSGSSILGEHRVAGNYSPEIRFNLTQDFMGPLNPVTSGATSLQLSWTSVPAANGYYAWVMGFQPGNDGQPRDMVWWASSASRNFGGALWDWLSPATVQRLVGQKVVMPPSQTSCLIPQEVKQAIPAGMMIGNMYAYGPEANFAYPPRPANPKTPWKPEWTTRVRYRSNAMWFVNGPPGMGDASGSRTSDEQEPSQKKCKRGFGGLLGAVTGTGC